MNSHIQTHADTHRHTKTHTDTYRHTDTHRHTQTHTYTHIHIDTGTLTHTHTLTQPVILHLPIHQNLTRSGGKYELQLLGAPRHASNSDDLPAWLNMTASCVRA